MHKRRSRTRSELAGGRSDYPFPLIPTDSARPDECHRVLTLFDTTFGGATDTDLWVRLFSRYGVRCLPQATCAYTIHEAAATTVMWNRGTIQDAHRIFDRAIALGLVPERIIRRWQADFLHQFILAGAYRRLRMGRRAEAREVLRLFQLPEVRDRGVSPKWLPVRAAFTAATAGARPKAG
jgi:hypothetical protein